MAAKHPFSLYALLTIGALFAIVFAVSAFGPAFVVEKAAVNSISRSQVFQSGSYSSSDRIVIEELTVKNDYFLPRGYELPPVMACLYDSTGTSKGTSIGLSYGDFINSASPFRSQLGTTAMMSDFAPYSSYSSGPAYGTIELAAGAEKKVQLLLTPSYYSSGDEFKYDEILLVNTDSKSTDYYSFCQSIGDATRASAAAVIQIE